MTESSMAPRIHVITLGVADLERALAFYRDGLGWDTKGIVGTEYAGDEEAAAGAVAMFTLADGLILSLYPRSELAKDAGVPGLPSGSAISLGHLVDSPEDVDAVLALAARAGGRVLGAPHDRPWGIYSGYFSDPDDHMWEVIYFNAR